MNSSASASDRELIIKYLAGEATPEEAMYLDEWMKYPDGKSELFAFIQLWNSTGETKIPQDISYELYWEELQSVIGNRKPALSPAVRFMRYSGIAASVIGIILCAYFFFFSTRTEQPRKKGELTEITEKARDSIRHIALRDGSFISLARNSEIRYHGPFGSEARVVTLSGEAFFDVAHDTGRPFIITIGEVSIEVVGTSFNVRTGAEGRSVEVQVKSGIVKMTAGNSEITVGADQTGIYFTGSRKLILKAGIDRNAIGYATRSFFFNDQSLLEVCRYLEKSFDVRIDLDRVKFNDCRITAQFDNASLTYILDVITATVEASYRQSNEQIFIEGEGCH